VPDLYWRRDGQVVRNPAGPTVDLDALPFASRDALASLRARNLPILSAYIYTSRGCKAHCTFCTVPGLAKGRATNYRFRDPARVVDEMESVIANYDVRTFYMADDNFLGYGEEVAGYFGSERGRDMNRVGSWGTPETVEPPPTRFKVVYHLAHVGEGPPQRVRLQVFTDEGRVPSVVGIWPTADWHEREQYDLMGIQFDGHPNLRRLIMPSDWDGHPLRKDYPIGGEPVQFTDAV